MKLTFMTIAIFFSSLTLAQSKSFDCGFLTGLVAGSQGISMGTLERALNVDAWFSVYGYNKGKIHTFRDEIVKHSNLVNSQNVKSTLTLIVSNLDSTINRPTQAGNVDYWLSQFQSQTTDFASIVQNIRITRDNACGFNLRARGL